MNTEDLLFDDGRQWKIIEHAIKSLPYFKIDFPFAFFIKTKDSIDACYFMISSQQEDVLWIFYLIADEKNYTLQGHMTSIHVVTKK